MEELKNKVIDVLENIYESIYVNKTLIIGFTEEEVTNINQVLLSREFQFTSRIDNLNSKRIYVVDEATLLTNIDECKIDISEFNVILCREFNYNVLKIFMDNGDVKIVVLMK